MDEQRSAQDLEKLAHVFMAKLTKGFDGYDAQGLIDGLRAIYGENVMEANWPDGQFDEMQVYILDLERALPDFLRQWWSARKMMIIHCTCAVCGTELASHWQHADRGSLLKVQPCQTCLGEAHEKGYAVGYRESTCDHEDRQHESPAGGSQ